MITKRLAIKWLVSFAYRFRLCKVDSKAHLDMRVWKVEISDYHWSVPLIELVFTLVVTFVTSN